MSAKARIALTLGDPGGIGPELVARHLARPERYLDLELFVVGDETELHGAMADAGVTFEWSRNVGDGTPTLVDSGGDRPSEGFARCQATEAGGRWAMSSLRCAFELAKCGDVDAIVYAPLNKTSLHMAGMSERDETSWFGSMLGEGASATELNLLPSLVTARVTSHCSIAEVAGLITRDLIISRALLLEHTLRARGITRPRIGVCALNPHGGEGGAFGRHEIDIISPGIADLQHRGVNATGPFPSDTIFLRAQDGAFDGVLTMYHDQGQIAVKLLGFDQGVTMVGGLSVPICTPAHGTAFDLVGTRSASTGAYEYAFDTAAAVAAHRRAMRPAVTTQAEPLLP